jgi:hypothetical protein
MLRVLSIFGLAGLFLAISAKLREHVQEAIGGMVSTVQVYAPYSYVAGALLLFAAMVVSFNRGSQAR